MKKNSILSVCFLIMAPFAAFSQNCWFVEWGERQPLLLSQDNRARLVYDQILADTSGNWNILLIRLGGLQNNQRSIYLKSSGYQVSAIKKDRMGHDSSFLLDSMLSNKLYSIVTKKDSINGFYAGDCDKVSAHESELLVIKNHQLNKWIEAYSARGGLQEVLQGKKEYDYLLAICEFINTVE